MDGNAEAEVEKQESNVAFVMLGGEERYRQQARDLGIKNVFFIDFVASVEKIHEFLSTLNVFTHGRSDGEVCSAAIIEALYHGLPVISHPGWNNGHMGQIKDCGVWCQNIPDYTTAMLIFKRRPETYKIVVDKTNFVYERDYKFDTVVGKINKIIDNLIGG